MHVIDPSDGKLGNNSSGSSNSVIVITKMDSSSTPIQKYFENATIFVVGATGLLGSLLIEKLLRTCPDVKKIYILLRLKKGISSEERFGTFFNRFIFEKLKITNPESLHKVVLVSGDCCQPNLGLSAADLEKVKNEVNCIFYCAASMNFEENFRTSVVTNIVAVRDLLKIARELLDLRSIVYVSTAFFYGWKNKKYIVYEKIDDTNKKLPEQLETLCENFDDEFIEKIKTVLIDKDTNIYTTTKWAAEILIKKYGEGLPVALVRPSMITPTLSDPIPGWIDNTYGPIGAFLGMALGIIRVSVYKTHNNMDMIPADYVTNCMIASAWDICRPNNKELLKNGTIKNGTNGTIKSSTVKIYNCVTSSRNPVTYGKALGTLLNYHKSMPYTRQIFYDKVLFTSNVRLYYILKYILCFIPASIIEMISYCMLRPTRLTAKLRKQINLYEQVLTFPLSNWNIRDDNVQNLWKDLKGEDKMLYNFDVSKIDWNLYLKSFVEGVRIYLLKDPMETVPKALKRRAKLKTIYYSTAASAVVGFLLVVKKLRYSQHS